jgi:hypothetical protein
LGQGSSPLITRINLVKIHLICGQKVFSENSRNSRTEMADLLYKQWQYKSIAPDYTNRNIVESIKTNFGNTKLSNKWWGINQ